MEAHSASANPAREVQETPWLLLRLGRLSQLVCFASSFPGGPRTIPCGDLTWPFATGNICHHPLLDSLSRKGHGLALYPGNRSALLPCKRSARCVVLSPAARSAGMPHDVAAAALKKNLEVAFKIEGTQWGRRYCPESMASTRSLNPETECLMFPYAAQAAFQALKANFPARYELSKLLDVGSPLLIPGSEVRTRKQS